MNKFDVIEDETNHRVVLWNRSATEYIVVQRFDQKAEAYDYAMRLNAVQPTILAAPVKGANKMSRNVPVRSKPHRRVIIDVPVICTTSDSLSIAKKVFNAARVACMDKDWFRVSDLNTGFTEKKNRAYLMNNMKEHFKRRNYAGAFIFGFRNPKLITAAVEMINADHKQQRDMFKY